MVKHHQMFTKEAIEAARISQGASAADTGAETKAIKTTSRCKSQLGRKKKRDTKRNVYRLRQEGSGKKRAHPGAQYRDLKQEAT